MFLKCLITNIQGEGLSGTCIKDTRTKAKRAGSKGEVGMAGVGEESWGENRDNCTWATWKKIQSLRFLWNRRDSYCITIAITLIPKVKYVIVQVPQNKIICYITVWYPWLKAVLIRIDLQKTIRSQGNDSPKWAQKAVSSPTFHLVPSK